MSAFSAYTFIAIYKVAKEHAMDISWLMSFLLGLPVAMLALLKTIDWCKKRQAGDRAARRREQLGREPVMKEEAFSVEPVDQATFPLFAMWNWLRR
jgi:hypothetical protein